MMVNGEVFKSFNHWKDEMEKRQKFAYKWIRLYLDRPHMPNFKVWRKLSNSVKKEN